MPRAQTQRSLSRLVLALPVLAAAILSPGRRSVLINTTPSEPPGVYIHSQDRPATGRLIAFSAPGAAFPYADAHLSYLRRVPLLKAVAAAGGDVVCTTSGRLVINGRDRAPIAASDGEGRALPHWRGCRALHDGELFVFSDRVPNSFDSRYFGPLPPHAAAWVYRPVNLPWSAPR